MSLGTRIRKLEEKLLLQNPKTCWLMWRDCKWAEADGIMRQENESILDFKERVLLATDKRFIWVR